MKRLLITATAALVALVVVLLGFTAIAGAGSHATTGPRSGHYTGRDVQGQTIDFRYSQGRITSFTIGGAHVGPVTVTHGSWTNVCHSFCTNGTWINDTQVHGSYHHRGGSHHYGWHASLRHISGGETHLFR